MHVLPVAPMAYSGRIRKLGKRIALGCFSGTIAGTLAPISRWRLSRASAGVCHRNPHRRQTTRSRSDMAEKENLPPDSPQDSKSGQSTPTPTPVPDSDADPILDFGMTATVREGASGVIPLADLPDPQSSPSLVSWTEVIRHHRETAQPLAPDMPVEPVKIDST